MLLTLICITALLCGFAMLRAWSTYHDVFHPLVLITPMFAFMYVLMPLWLINDNRTYSYVNEDQCIFAQTIIILGLFAFIIGCLASSQGQSTQLRQGRIQSYDRVRLQKGAYFLGSIGVLAWVYGIQNAGGILNVFSESKGMGWSDVGYIRDAAYLMIVAQLVLLSREAFDPKNKRWIVAVICFAVPYLLQGLLGAQRGPTMLVVGSLGLSWYLAQQKRPPLALLMGGAAGLAFLMLFLVTNRGNIHLGSDAELNTDVSSFFAADNSNEYIFGVGCIISSNATGDFFWGRRYLAQILVRPVPHQIWPTKYADFGVPEIEHNAGVAGPGLEAIMGWKEELGAAAGMIADVWVEFSWLCIPFLGVIGWMTGYVWRRAVEEGEHWNTVFTVMCLLSVYFVSQSGEAVIFRLLILIIPANIVWRSAGMKTAVIPSASRLRIAQG
jgi:oligosaccharide repeat unit polymerase